MRKSVLMYSLLLLFTYGCTNNEKNNQGQSGSLQEMVETILETNPKDTFSPKEHLLPKTTAYTSL